MRNLVRLVYREELDQSRLLSRVVRRKLPNPEQVLGLIEKHVEEVEDLDSPEAGVLLAYCFSNFYHSWKGRPERKYGRTIMLFPLSREQRVNFILKPDEGIKREFKSSYLFIPFEYRDRNLILFFRNPFIHPESFEPYPYVKDAEPDENGNFKISAQQWKRDSILAKLLEEHIDPYYFYKR